MKRSHALAVALVLGFSLHAQGPAAACQGARAALDYVTPNTLHVVVKPFAKSYSRGDKVKVTIVVTRPADEDPAGLGVATARPVTQPADDINVGIGISVGRAFLPGYGKTDENGKLTTTIKLGSHVPSGVATVRAYAYKERANTPCLVVEEQGYRTVSKAFKVTSG